MVGTVTIGAGESTEKRELVEATCLPADKSRRLESSIDYVSTIICGSKAALPD